MELQRWKVFKYLDSNFVADVKHAYLVGITSLQTQESDDDDDATEGNAVCNVYKL